MAYVKTNWVDNTTPINETNLNKIESGIENNDINIGEENYDNTRTYEVGDIVRYNEKIYKCITAITTAENFDNSKWEQTNIVEIVQSEKSKIYELIEAISTPIVGEGENITLNDTAEKRFENFDIEGNSEQETRSGKNLIDESNISEAASSEGIRYNGSYVYDDTPNSDSRGWTYDNCNYYLSLPAGTYTLSLNFRKKITNNVGGLFRFYKPDNTFIGNLSGLNVDYASVSFTLTETTNLGLYFKLMDGQVNIQLEEGSTATPYEQYGASPSPDYPSEVKSCGDNINEFDITKYDYRNNAGATAQITDETTFRITATMNNNANCSTGFKILDLTNYAGKTLSVKAFVKSSTDTNNAFMVLRQNNSDYSGTATNILYDETQRTTDGVITLNYKVASTINDSNRYLFIHFYATRGTECNIGDYVDYKVKLVPNTDAGEYSEYGQGCVEEIIRNKNFVNIIAENTTSNGITITNNGDGSVTLNGTATANISFVIADIDIKSTGYGYYTLSNKIVSGSYSTARLRISLKNSNATANLMDKSINEVLTSNIQADTGDLRIWCENGVVLNNIKILTQLEKGQSKTDLEIGKKQTYTIPTQQPMRAIGDTRDKFILKENGKWYERHNILRYYYTGQENIGINAVSGTVNRFSITLSDINNSTDNANNIIAKSNYFLGISHNNRNNVNNSIFSICNGSSHTLAINTSEYSTVADFKTWLQSLETPLYADYISVTPTDIECTSEQTEILNQIYIKAKSYKGVTHIYSNDAVSPNCYVEAVKDLTTLIQ